FINAFMPTRLLNDNIQQSDSTNCHPTTNTCIDIVFYRHSFNLQSVPLIVLKIFRFYYSAGFIQQ
ncbi:MAG: hypothetical protein R6V32_03015, partial [Bacteroidales bacterium]